MIIKSLTVSIAVSSSVALIHSLTVLLGYSSWESVISTWLILIAIIFLTHHWKSLQYSQINEKFNRLEKQALHLERNIAEVHGLTQLTTYNSPFPLPFGGGWALTADTASIIAREIVLCRPNLVLELGSGVSTILTAKLLKQAGTGQIISLDHDPVWAEKTRQYLIAAGLDDVATVYDAPLIEYELNGKPYNWYKLPERFSDLPQIDVLTIDGPPTTSNPDGMARYPAMPLLIDKLSKQAIVFVDDAKREDERKMVELWTNDSAGWANEAYDTADGLVILRKTEQ